MATLYQGFSNSIGNYYSIYMDDKPDIKIPDKVIKKAARDAMNLIHEQLPDGAFNSTIVKIVMDEMKEMMYFLPLSL